MKNVIKTLTIIAAIVITVFLSIHFDDNNDNKRADILEECHLPIIYMLDGDFRYNPTFGYVRERDYDIGLDYVTILPDSRRLSVDLLKYNAWITGVSYEIRSLDGNNLYEDTVVEELEDRGEYIRATLGIKNLLEENTDYLLILKLEVKDVGEVFYYGKLRYDNAARVEYKAGLIREFSDTTLDKTKVSTLKKYMETSDEMDNTDFGYVNIHSSIEILGFNEIPATRVSDVIYKLRCVDGEQAVMEMDSRIKLDFSEGSSIFNTSEIFTLEESKTGMYLMGYERFCEEEYREEGSIKSTSRVYLGISDDKNVDYMIDSDENYMAYVVNRELYMYDTRDDSLCSIFTFVQQEGGLREYHDEHDIRILKVSDKGDVRFLVYGYMNSGIHEGELGMSVMEFDYKEKTCTEIGFVPYRCDFETLRSNMSEIVYVDKNDNIILIVDDALISIDHESGEVTQIISKLGDYAINQDKSKIAYVENDTLYIYEPQSQKREEVLCDGEGRTISIIGYIEGDVVYGTGNKADIYVDGAKKLLMMDKIYIRDEKLDLIKEYDSVDGYVIGGEVVGNRVNLFRVRKNEGGIVPIDMDQLMNKNDNKTVLKDAYREVSTQKRLKERVLLLPGQVYDVRKVGYTGTVKVIFDEHESKNAWSIKRDATEDIYTLVNMKYLCNPTYKAKAYYEDSEATDGYDRCMDIMKHKVSVVLEVKDKTLDDVLGFVAMGGYVLSKDPIGQYILICGYSKTDITAYDPSKDNLSYYKKSDITDTDFVVGY